MNTISDNAKTQAGLRTFAVLMIGFLIVQYVLGMVTNLWVEFPQTDQVNQLWDAARSQLPSAAHIVLGVLLLVGAIIFVIRAAAKHQRDWVVSSAVGLVGILVAAVGGATYVSSQSDTWSMVMALGFIASLVAYGWGVYAAMR